MNSIVLNKKLMIIAGPCSVDPENVNDIFEIAEIKISNRFGRKQRAIFGTRVIGLKSRTSLNKDGKNMGLPVHQAAKRTKLATKAKLFFDPSHIHGPKLRDSIVRATVEAIQMKIDEENFLYDGILIEVGRSKTDTEQHITVKELKELCCQLAEFRDLSEPN